MADEISLTRINDAVANIGNLQVAIEPTDDLQLGYKMLGYKDADGNPLKVLAKDKNARVDNLTMLALIGSGDRYIGVDSNGKAKVMSSPANSTDQLVKVSVDDSTAKYLQDSFSETSTIEMVLDGNANTNQKVLPRVKISTDSDNIATITAGVNGGIYVPPSPDEKVKVLATDTTAVDLVTGLDVDTTTNALKRIVTANATSSSIAFDIQGADTATPGQVFQRKADSSFGFDDIVPISVVRREVLKSTSALVAQNPPGLDTAQIVSFGDAQTSPTGLLEIDALGVLTALAPCTSIATVFIQYGRTTSAGSANLFARGIYLPLGGSEVQVGHSIRAKLDDSDTLIPEEFDINLILNTGDKFWFEILRSSEDGGINNGGLYDGDPTVAGWAASTCAELTIFDYAATGEGLQSSEHNDLEGKQGGAPGEYFHLTADQVNDVNTIDSLGTGIGNNAVDIIGLEDRKLDKVDSAPQSVVSEVAFNSGVAVTGTLGDGSAIRIPDGRWIRPQTPQDSLYLTNGTDPGTNNSTLHLTNGGSQLTGGSGTTQFGSFEQFTTQSSLQRTAGTIYIQAGTVSGGSGIALDDQTGVSILATDVSTSEVFGVLNLKSAGAQLNNGKGSVLDILADQTLLSGVGTSGIIIEATNGLLDLNGSTGIRFNGLGAYEFTNVPSTLPPSFLYGEDVGGDMTKVAYVDPSSLTLQDVCTNGSTTTTGATFGGLLEAKGTASFENFVALPTAVSSPSPNGGLRMGSLNEINSRIINGARYTGGDQLTPAETQSASIYFDGYITRFYSDRFKTPGVAYTPTEILKITDTYVRTNMEHRFTDNVVAEARLIQGGLNDDGSTGIQGTNAKFTNDVEAEAFSVTALNTAPSSATDTGTTGEIRYTSDYIYTCVAANTWKRSALTTW